MRQDSKNEEKENGPKDFEKVNIVNLANKQKSTEDKQQINKLPQNDKMANQQVANIKEQKNLEAQNSNEFMDNLEKMKKVDGEDRGKLSDNIKRFENQQKLINNKSSPSSKKQLGMNEKRKSAPVKPEMIEDLSKIIYNKHLSLQDKDE